jgi:large subunit ribosomal protein L28
MGQKCAITGKKPVMGNQKTYRGKAKYLGGVGKKITGISRRKFKPNLQKIKVVLPNGQVKRLRVAASAIRSGLVTRPVKRKPFQLPTNL